MIGSKLLGNFILSVRLCKKGFWVIISTFIIWKEGLSFIWMKFIIRIVYIKLVELKKGGKV